MARQYKGHHFLRWLAAGLVLFSAGCGDASTASPASVATVAPTTATDAPTQEPVPEYVEACRLRSLASFVVIASVVPAAVQPDPNGEGGATRLDLVINSVRFSVHTPSPREGDVIRSSFYPPLELGTFVGTDVDVLWPDLSKATEQVALLYVDKYGGRNQFAPTLLEVDPNGAVSFPTPSCSFGRKLHEFAASIGREPDLSLLEDLSTERWCSCDDTPLLDAALLAEQPPPPPTPLWEELDPKNRSISFQTAPASVHEQLKLVPVWVSSTEETSELFVRFECSLGLSTSWPITRTPTLAGIESCRDGEVTIVLPNLESTDSLSPIAVLGTVPASELDEVNGVRLVVDVAASSFELTRLNDGELELLTGMSRESIEELREYMTRPVA